MTEIFTKPRSLTILVQFVLGGADRYIQMWQSKREISREYNDIIGSAKGSQISEKYWGEVGKRKMVDVYLTHWATRALKSKLNINTDAYSI